MTLPRGLTDGGVAACVEDLQTGCTAWADAEACPQGQACRAGACVPAQPLCVDDCVFTKQSVPSGVDFYSVRGSSAKAVWVVGALYYNGATWKSIDSGVGTLLECVHGSGPDDVYAISHDAAIVRRDGAAWSPWADLAPIWGGAACVSVLGPQDVMAIVHEENGEKQELWRITDGQKTKLATYAPLAVFTPDGGKARTIALRAFSPTAALVSAELALRWDGAALKNTGAPNPSFALWALAPDLAFAAASHSGIGHRWDGQTWKIVNPGLDGYSHMFAGTAQNRVFGVGEREVDEGAAVVVYDGVGWSPATMPAGAKALFAGWAWPTGEVFAVGQAGTVVIGK